MAMKSEFYLHKKHNRLYYEQPCILATQFPPLTELLQSVFWRWNFGDDQGFYTSEQKTTQSQQGRWLLKDINDPAAWI